MLRTKLFFASSDQCFYMDILHVCAHVHNICTSCICAHLHERCVTENVMTASNMRYRKPATLLILILVVWLNQKGHSYITRYCVHEMQNQCRTVCNSYYLCINV